jgi:hypothetical protein
MACQDLKVVWFWSFMGVALGVVCWMLMAVVRWVRASELVNWFLLEMWSADSSVTSGKFNIKFGSRNNTVFDMII